MIHPETHRSSLLVALGLLFISGFLQTGAFVSPGWFRLNVTCGDMSLIYMNVPKGLLEGDLTLLQTEECEAKTIPDVVFRRDTEDFEYLIYTYNYTNDIITAVLSILFTGLSFVLTFIYFRSTGKQTFLTLALHFVCVAAVLQWTLVFRYSQYNITKYIDNGLRRLGSTTGLLFPYSLCLFAIGAFLSLIGGVLQLVVYVKVSRVNCIKQKFT